MSQTGAQLRRGPLYEGLRTTREEYLDLPADGYKYDMIDGVLHMAPSANFEHGDCTLAFGHALRGFLERQALGRAVVEIDVFLPDGGDVVRPDISFLLKERLHIVKTHIHGAPDLVAEVLSDATAARDLGEKSERYLRTGVREYWIIDPRDQSIRVRYSRQNSSRWEERTGSELSSELLPGFAVTTTRLFA